MKRIEIVTHCWAGQLDLYAKLLRLQVWSLLTKANHLSNTCLTICAHTSDVETVSAVNWARVALDLKDIEVKLFWLPTKMLFRRAIGRNLAAKETTADVVWFTDCDYLFFDDCLDRAIEASLQHKGSLVYPEAVKANVNHELGDNLISQVAEDSMLISSVFCEEEFIPKSYRRAIGGIQIIDGDYCRALGYLDGTKWTRDLKDSSKGFLPCRCDVRYRKTVGRSIASDIPGCYRVRHSECGRNVPLLQD